MTRRWLTDVALAVIVATGLTGRAQATITSKETLYCELETPNGSSSCLFPMTVTKWPPWIPDNAKQSILGMEGLFSDISGLVSGVSAVQSAIKTVITIAANLGLYTPPPSQLDLIQKDIREILDRVKALQTQLQATYDGLYWQADQLELQGALREAMNALDAYGNFNALHPNLEACIASGNEYCFPFYQNEQYAHDAQLFIDSALNLLDVTGGGFLSPVWMDNGTPTQRFDPRLAAAAYLTMVAQELQILSWEVGAQRLPTNSAFRARLLRRATFINQVLIPNVKDWVHSRCETGPNVRVIGGPPSPLGTSTGAGSYRSWYFVRGQWLYYLDGFWKKNCDYSSTETQVWWTTTNPPYPQLPPPATNPYYKGDPTEMATLERVGLNNWSYMAANLVGVANGAAYSGCFSRSTYQALLPNQRSVEGPTVANCINAARVNGDNFAQLAATKCYTGNGIGKLRRIRDSSCDNPCYGLVNGTLQRTGEMCGGYTDGSGVYRVVSSPDVLVASNVVGGKTAYLGCYQPPGGTTQALSVASAEACLRAAVTAHVVYASVEPGGVCKFTDNLGLAPPLPESNCMTPCPANSGQMCGGVGAASVFATNDPLPTILSCSNGTADCNGVLTDGCETNVTLAANCGACGINCKSTEYCAVASTCQPTSLVSYAFLLNQAVSFTGTSSQTGSQGAFVSVTGASTRFYVPAGMDVALNLELFAYKPSGPSDMSLDLRYLVDGLEKARTRLRPDAMSFVATLSGLSGGDHSVSVEVRSVLNSGPPTTIQLYGNDNGASTGCYTYGCGPRQAKLKADVVRK